jgi:hypothetical protein
MSVTPIVSLKLYSRMRELLEHLRVAAFIGVVLEGALTVGLLDVVITG